MKLTADQVLGFSIGSRAHVRLTCSITGQDCSGLDKGLKVNRIITFSSIKIFFAALFCVYGDD